MRLRPMTSQVGAKTLVLLFVFIVLGIFLTRTPTTSSRAGAQERNSSNALTDQVQQRTVVKKTDFDPPLKITTVKTKRGVVETEKRFSDDDDWLSGLTVKLANQSGKTVTFVGIELLFRRTEDQEPGPPAGWSVEYGLDPFDSNEESAPLPQFAAVPPGQNLEIKLSDRRYEELKSFLREIQFPSSIKQIELRVIKIGFNDGTAWNAGYLFRRDPQSLQGPLPGWILLDETGDKPQVKQPPSSALNRTAFFWHPTSKGSYSENPWTTRNQNGLISMATSFVTGRKSKTRTTRSLAVGPGMCFW